MSNIRAVLHFGWRYLRHYRGRLAVGILLGILFGLTNASFVWATKTLIDRFNPPPASSVSVSPVLPASAATVLGPAGAGRLERLREQVDAWIDPWLPRAGRTLDWQSTIGGLLFLPLLVLLRSSTDYGSGYCIGWVSERVVNDMRIEVLEKLSSLSLSFFNRSTTGDLLARVNLDTWKLLQCLKQGAANLVKESVTLVSVLGALFLMNWQLTLFVAILFPARAVGLEV
jgi:subfamily B ATP-binding cassette protein MsbA